ncbi:MAG TPA: acyl carrier protein [Paludibacter sp.]|nr:acyl carrier protein [Paludibacter sp.]
METSVKIKGDIRQYLAKAALLDADAIKDDTLIFEEGLLDSMGLLFLVEFIKEKFDVDANDNELITENFESVNNISSFVCKKIDLKMVGKVTT